jgi:heme/copper-type cytochrome/quinol oxidase subunit 3
MRWKLVVPASIIAALLAVTLWSTFAIAIFGSAWAMARNDWPLIGSLVIPLGVSTFAAVFTYRHTARRRKTQAILTFVLAWLFSAGFYLVASQIFPEKLIIPRTSEVRHAR